MRSPRLSRLTVAAAAALAVTVAPMAMLVSTSASAQASGCYGGVTVLNPYASSCSIPGPVNRVRGSAPDANAIIACRHHPGCLAAYINGP
jgi:hypothetical protein